MDSQTSTTGSKPKTERIVVMSVYDWSDGETDVTYPLSTEKYGEVMDRLGLPHGTPDEWRSSMSVLIERGWQSVPQNERGFGSGQHNLYVEVPVRA